MTWAYRYELQIKLMMRYGRCSMGAVFAMVLLNCTTVVRRRSRHDRVSANLSFRWPAVELLVVTIHSWAQPCHTKSARQGPIRRVMGWNFTGVSGTRLPTTWLNVHPLPSSKHGVMAILLFSYTLQVALTSFYHLFSSVQPKALYGQVMKMLCHFFSA